MQEVGVFQQPFLLGSAFPSWIGLRMPGMLFPVLCVPLGQLPIVEDQKIFRVSFLRRPCEIKRSRNDDFSINDHDLIMGNGMLSIDFGLDPRIQKEVRRRIFIPLLLTLIEDNLDLDPPLMSLQQCLRNGSGGKGIGLDKDHASGFMQLSDDRLRTPAVG